MTFGGGEPLLYPEFIRDFHKVYPIWNIVVQTSLNVDNLSVKMLTETVDEWIIDIKDVNPAVYRAYTGKDNRQVFENLIFLLKYVPNEKIICRVPHITNYNTESDVRYSIQKLKESGVQRIDEFQYIVCAD